MDATLSGVDKGRASRCPNKHLRAKARVIDARQIDDGVETSASAGEPQWAGGASPTEEPLHQHLER